MKGFPKWLMPAVLVAIVLAVVLAAGKFADEPVVFMRGNINISKELISKATGIETLFIVVYDADSPMPMPYGAMRDNIKIGKDERLTDFILTPARLEVMRPGSPVPKNFRLKVRLDRDGFGGKDQIGDLVGEVAAVAYGTTDVQVQISKIIQ